jgi:uncharacterized protein with FMN-binding domain
MRKWLILSTVVLVLIGIITTVGMIFFNQVNAELSKLDDIPLTEIDLSSIDDGTYIGEYNTSVIKVKVSVTVINHEITMIELLKHDNGQGGDAVNILDDVIENQSIMVDSIAGATYSSKVILLAIQDALSE